MILFFCYVCPPIAVLLMRRPFSAVLNIFLTAFGWFPGMRHAFVLYADYKVTGSVREISSAIHNPRWIQERVEPSRGRGKRKPEPPPIHDHPRVGMHGTRFRRR